MEELLIRLKTNFKVTYLLLGINLVMFIITLILTFYFQDFRQLALLYLGADYLPAIIQGEVWRFVLSAFLHANIIHLIINMWALWNVGGIVERFYGGKKLWLVYVVGAIFASAGSFIADAITLVQTGSLNQGFTVSVGASGALFALVGLIIGNNYNRDESSIKIYNYINTNQLWLVVFYNLIIGFGFNLIGGPVLINNWAHIGGFVGGVLLGLFLDPINSFTRKGIKVLLQKILFAFSVLAVLLSFLVHFALLLI